MNEQSQTLQEKLALDQYPRSSQYPAEWALENLMGPNVLWLTESLTQLMDLKPGMRVLDMGCGKGISSIFLAKEFDVQVWAVDLWISASENWERIQAAGLGDRVFPIHAEAHTLPFADNFFDAAVSFDAYHYFGTNNLYTAYYAKFVRPGGEIGIVVPGLVKEIDQGLPAHLEPYWEGDFYSFHSPEWWARHWTRSGSIEITHADVLPDGWREWHLWESVCRDHGYRHSPEEMEMLALDQGRHIGFSRVLGRKTA